MGYVLIVTVHHYFLECDKLLYINKINYFKCKLQSPQALEGRPYRCVLTVLTIKFNVCLLFRFTLNASFYF